MRYNVVIRPDGEVVWVYDDALTWLHELGQVVIARASHVEPNADGQWIADLGPVGGPVLGPFRLRAEALAAERAWLEAHLPNGGKL